MKAAIAIFIMALLCGTMVDAQEENQTMSTIIPTPQHTIVKNICFKVGPGTKIILGSNSKQEQFAAQQINDEFAGKKEVQLKIVSEHSLRKLPVSFIFIGSPTSEYGRQFLRERKGTLTPAMKEEGYFLDVDANGVVVIAESEKGKFYGVMSLLQMLYREKRSILVGGVTIEDFPLEKIRGISDDISRGQVSTVENFKKIIRFLARYKLNTFSPYLEDMFAFKEYPLIGKGRGALTAQEVKELDGYAKKYYVDMIPTFETLGHWENVLAKPEYVAYAEFPGAQTLNVSDEKIYTMLDEMIGELCASFSSPYFNMGADESWDVGLGANKERVQKNGLAAVHAEHYKRIADIVRKHGKKPMMYGDIILNQPEILGMIPNDITIVDWHYDASFAYKSTEVFKKAGFTFIASPAVWSFTGPFPNYLNTFVNIQNFNRDGFEKGSLGLLTSNWNDYGGEELRELNYYGYAWTAECAWQPAKADAEVFNRVFFKIFFGAGGCEELESAYAILSSPANDYSWHELWRHPMLPFREQSQEEGYLPLAVRLQSITSTMPIVLSLLAKGKNEITENEDQLRYLEFIARLNLWFAKKVEDQENVKRLSTSAVGGTNNDSVAATIIDLCGDVLKDLSSLKNEFESLWLATNKSAGLDLLMARYDRQASYWQEKIDEVKHGRFWVNPEIESAWIYHPYGISGKKDSTQTQKAYFRRTFIAPKNLRSATLQLIGDTHAKVFVNGRSVGEVYVRSSNSLSIEHERIKMFSILPLLNDSMNIIAAEAETFAPSGSAGINIYCELELADSSIEKIISDGSWKVAENATGNWTEASFNDSSWVNAAPKPYPCIVVRPNFATGRSSWMER
ncbi:MAG: family 20 glycosylhydrolase [Bacteroidota bacterium]